MDISPRDQSLVSSKISCPQLSLRQLGKRYNISGERVRQILTKHGITTQRKVIPRLCKHCGKEIFREKGTYSNTFYHPDCKLDKYHPLIPCFTCGKEFRRSATELRSRSPERGYKSSRNFCSNSCQGVHVGNTYGWGSHGKRREEVLIEGATIIFRWGSHVYHEGTILNTYRLPDGKRFDVKCNECEVQVGTNVRNTLIKLKR